MKRPGKVFRFARGLTSLLLMWLPMASRADTTHFSKIIAELQPPQAAHDCVYIRLAGVTQADPLTPGGAYFALPRTQVGFNEVYALVLSAYVSGTPVSIRTTSSLVGGECGAYIGITWLISP